MKRHAPASASVPVGNSTRGLQTIRSCLLLISGQIPEDASGNLPDSFAAQCESVCYNTGAVLKLARMTYTHLVKVTTFYPDQVEANRQIRRPFLGGPRPALPVVVAGTLEPPWLLETEVIAAG